MGTSASSSGARPVTPLVPSWVEQPVPVDLPAAPPDMPLPNPPGCAPLAPPGEVPSDQPPPPIEAPSEPDRFRGGRVGFSRYAGGGAGGGGGLGRSLRNYISRANGGAKGAARRMGIARKTAANLLGFTQAVNNRGMDAALREIGLDQLVGRPFDEVLPELIDALCADDGGSIDEGIARSALSDVFAELSAEGLETDNNLSQGELTEVIVGYIAQTIRLRLLHDIGIKAIKLPSDVTAVLKLQNEVYALIKETVRDSVTARVTAIGKLSPKALQTEAGRIYELAHEVILANTEE